MASKGQPVFFVVVPITIIVYSWPILVRNSFFGFGGDDVTVGVGQWFRRWQTLLVQQPEDDLWGGVPIQVEYQITINDKQP